MCNKRAQRHIFSFVFSSLPPVLYILGSLFSYFILCLASYFICLGVIGKGANKFHTIISTIITTTIALSTARQQQQNGIILFTKYIYIFLQMRVLFSRSPCISRQANSTRYKNFTRFLYFFLVSMLSIFTAVTAM